jgi:HEAT repeat protein
VTLRTARLGAARLAALLLACAGLLRPADADIAESVAAADPLEALLARVTAPASAEVVSELLASPEAQPAEGALRVVGALWHAGGPHAAEALRDFVRHEAAPVREAALRAIAVIGLRGVVGSKREVALRKALADEDPRVMGAAYEALARVGGPDDVERLIAGLSSPEGNVRSLALRALRGLTGERLARARSSRSRSPRRWRPSKPHPTRSRRRRRGPRSSAAAGPRSRRARRPPRAGWRPGSRRRVATATAWWPRCGWAR